jgi:peroxiredoxin
VEDERTSLYGDTVAVREAIRAEVGDDMDAWDRSAESLRGLTLRPPAVGATAPDFELPDATGRGTRLTTVLGHGAVVLVFYRGAWCPYCNLQLRAFHLRAGDIMAAGATLVAISPQSPDKTADFARQEDFAFTVLSDVGNHVARRYGLAYSVDDDSIALFKAGGLDLTTYNGDGRWQLPAAATFVVDREARIIFESVSADYRWRVGPDEVLRVLAEHR